MTDPGKHEVCKAAFKQDALEAWDDYQATGHHAIAIADEVEHWLAGWGSDDEAPAPPRRL
jgi:predicted transcriptional regulator